MATQEQFTNITSTQWSGISDQFKMDLIRVFNPSIAASLTIEHVRLMDANGAFKELLRDQLNLVGPGGVNSVNASGSNQTYANWNTKNAYIGNDYIASPPQFLIQAISHEIGHLARPGGTTGFYDASGAPWANPYTYATARSLSEGVARLAEWRVNLELPNDKKAGTGDWSRHSPSWRRKTLTPKGSALSRTGRRSNPHRRSPPRHIASRT